MKLIQCICLGSLCFGWRHRFRMSLAKTVQDKLSFEFIDNYIFLLLMHFEPQFEDPFIFFMLCMGSFIVFFLHCLKIDSILMGFYSNI